jgi:hypothetical protein
MKRETMAATVVLAFCFLVPLAAFGAPPEAPPIIFNEGLEKLVPPHADPANPTPSSRTEAQFSGADLALRAYMAGRGVAFLKELVDFYRDQEQQVPRGDAFWVEVKAEYVPPSGMTPGTGCPSNDDPLGEPQTIYYLNLTWRNIGRVNSPPPAPDERRACRQTRYVQVTGTGDPIQKRWDATLSISPRNRTISLCRDAYFEAKVGINVNGQPYTLPAGSMGVRWDVSDPQGLREIGDPGSLGPAVSEPVYLQGFRPTRPGQYTVTARVSVDTSSIPYLTEEARKQASQITASATVTVEEPKVTSVKVEPETVTVPAGGSAEFKAMAYYDTCPAENKNITYHPETQWTPSGSNVFHAPDPSPVGLRVDSPSHPEFKASVCDTASFQAFVTLRSDPQTQPITATYKNVPGSARVTIARAEREDPAGPAEVDWTPGSAIPIQDAKPIDVVAVHRLTGLKSAPRTLRVNKPALTLRVKARRPEIEVGEQAEFMAEAEYPERCLSGDVTQQAFPPGGNPVRATEPGATIEGKAAYRDPFGNEATETGYVKVRWPNLAITPDLQKIPLGSEVRFDAWFVTPAGSLLKNVTDEVEWPKGRVISGDRCEVKDITAAHSRGTLRATARVAVEMDAKECTAIRNALTSLAPDHLAESRQWMAKRDALLAKGCTCDVPDVPWTAGQTTTASVPGPGGGDSTWTAGTTTSKRVPGGGGGGPRVPPPLPPSPVPVGVPPTGTSGPGGPGGAGDGCGDPLRERITEPGGRITCGRCLPPFGEDAQGQCVLPAGPPAPGPVVGPPRTGTSGPGGAGDECRGLLRATVRLADGRIGCGRCLPGYVPDGQDGCTTPEALVQFSSCPFANMTKIYDPSRQQVLCCPGETPTWDPRQGVCLGQPDPALASPGPGMSPADIINLIGIMGTIPPAPTPRAPAGAAPSPAPSKCHVNPRTKQVDCSRN